jgi:hypothetical protein
MTNDNGDYVFPNVTPDTYTIEVIEQPVQRRWVAQSESIEAAGRRVRGGKQRGGHAQYPAASALLVLIERQEERQERST